MYIYYKFLYDVIEMSKQIDESIDPKIKLKKKLKFLLEEIRGWCGS